MYKKIIVALGLDHGHGVNSLDVARRLKSEGGEILAVHVIEPVPGFARYYLQSDNTEEIREGALKGIEERIGEAKDATAVLLNGHPGSSLIEYAEKVGADCIVVGSHKPDMKDYLLGSTAARVARHSPCAVHILR